MFERDHSVHQKTSDQPLASPHLTWPGLANPTVQPSPGLLTIKLHLTLPLNKTAKRKSPCAYQAPTVQCR
jgi:hypothetical protein